MATYVATAHKLFMGGLDVSCFANAYTLDLTADTVECTTFCSSGARDYKQGLRSYASSFDGYADFAAAGVTSSALVPGEVLTPSNQGSQFNVTWAPVGTEGSWCFLADSVLGNITPLGGSVGEMAMIHGELFPSDITVGQRMVHGIVEANRTISSSSNTTGSNTLGAVAAGKKMWASLHVFTLSGTSPTLDVKVQSDDNSGFTSPTDRITFTQATTRSGQWSSVAGAITDDYWRVVYTIGGSGGPTAAFAVSMGIL